MSIKGKLKDFKYRLTDRRMYTIVSLTLIGVLLWGVYQNRRATDYKNLLNNQYNRMFFDLTDNVNNIESLLAKSLISASPAKTSKTLQEAWAQANMAQMNIIQLPISQPYLDGTSKFLTQVGDLAFALNEQTNRGKEISEEQYNNIKMMYEYSKEVNNSIKAMQEELFSGRIRWNTIEKKGKAFLGKQDENLPGDLFADLNKSFEGFPTLIYDGPFSDHITQIEPVALGDKEITQEEGQEIALQFFGKDRVEKIEFFGAIQEDAIESYTFEVIFKDTDKDATGTIDITKIGGYPLWAISSRPVYESVIDMDQAKQIGRDFLTKMGFENMTDTYYIVSGNVATINYAAKQGEYILYPDLIKLQVALDNGEIMGIESKGYLYSHKERKIPEPTVTIDEARKLISPRVTIVGEGHAVIPTPFKTEVFTYEFKVKLEDRDCLVYIGTTSGIEEEILLIIDTDQGVLTVDNGPYYR
jgi:spore germination protein